MSRYFIEDVKCGYDTCFDCCGPHTTVASAIKYKNDDGKNRMAVLHTTGRL